MSAINRKTLRTSTTIFEYQPESKARRFFDGCVWVFILGGLALAGGALAFFAFGLW